LATHMQLPLASRADDAGHAATQTPEEHVPLTQSVPALHCWLFLSRHVPLEATNPLLDGHTHVLVANDHVAPPGQVHELVPPGDVDPAVQAVQGVRPSTVGAK